MRVFFYGLFMDEALLAAKGIRPRESKAGCVADFALRIGRRASLVPCPGDRVYGLVMTLDPQEAAALYAEESVADYRPVAVTVELEDGRQVEAQCYNLTPDKLTGANPDYAKSLLALATRLGLPDAYLAKIRNAGR